MLLSKKKKTKLKPNFNLHKQEQIAGVLFALPWIIGILIFYVYPILSSMYYSFFDCNAIILKGFVGFDNYRRAFASNEVKQAVINTIVFTIYSVPLGLCLGLSLALLLNNKMKGRNIFRAVIFIPSLVPSVAATMIFIQLFQSRFGIINSLLRNIGINGPAWLDNPALTKISLALLVQWAIGQMVITYIAALSDVPSDLYEAAKIDGSSTLSTFRNITLPLITPVIFYNLILELIYAAQQFSQAFVLSSGEGSPSGSLMMYSMLIYRNAFAYFDMGLACALSVLMFGAISLITLGIFQSSSKWVFYMGD